MKIAVKPIETIVFELEDREIKCRLTVRAFSLLQEEELCTIQKVFDDLETNPYEAVTKLIYVGCKPYNEEFDMNMAEVLAESMTIEQLTSFAETAKESVESMSDDLEKKPTVKSIPKAKKAKKTT
ncbi:MAG: hypothetical protein K9L62_16095 [Vallitaleaceae bacterium]|nr:hypothetical protein [Vallitaleaceae bacterium]